MNKQVSNNKYAIAAKLIERYDEISFDSKELQH